MNLVKLSDYGIKGENYYWSRRERYNLTEQELHTVGVFDGGAYVDENIIFPLQKANEIFNAMGYELIVKDAHRSPDLYKLVQAKRYILHGKELTDKLLNVVTMPHSSGRTVDVSLLDLKNGQEVRMRNSEDDPNGGYLIDYYKGRSDLASREFQRVQELLREVMLSVGFQLGIKKEFWHFEYPLKSNG